MLLHLTPRACLRLGGTSALVLATVSIVTAGLVSETSWRSASQDNRHLGVMVSPHPLADYTASAREAEIEIRNRYKQSGRAR